VRLRLVLVQSRVKLNFVCYGSLIHRSALVSLSLPKHTPSFFFVEPVPYACSILQRDRAHFPVDQELWDTFKASKQCQSKTKVKQQLVIPGGDTMLYSIKYPSIEHIVR
jgi:hypothetical protein